MCNTVRPAELQHDIFSLNALHSSGVIPGDTPKKIVVLKQTCAWSVSTKYSDLPRSWSSASTMSSRFSMQDAAASWLSPPYSVPSHHPYFPQILLEIVKAKLGMTVRTFTDELTNAGSRFVMPFFIAKYRQCQRSVHAVPVPLDVNSLYVLWSKDTFHMLGESSIRKRCQPL